MTKPTGNPTKSGLDRGELTAAAKKAGLSPSYLWQLAVGDKKCPLNTAAKIYTATGLKFGPLAEASNDDCSAVARVMRRAGLIPA